ncbi:MAG: phosphotransferase [Phycisphaerae bacterium]|nr:phosphotransferase [Phycisphaerae bacterium]
MDPERKRFDAVELATCLSHYDLGIIRSVQDFPRGSRRSPKVILESEKRGRLLFKRRAHGKDDIKKVAFTHQIQLHLAGENFPLPHLIGTRPDNNSMLVLNDRIYELFEFVQGKGYDGSLDATFDAGRILGLYHKLLANFQGDYHPPKGSYHGASAVGEAILNTTTSLPLDARPEPDVLMDTVKYLEQAYLRCTVEANKAGLKDWPMQIVHGDWHPGNMLFRGKLVAAVIDYDTARLQQRVIDLANGTIQFSIIGGSEDPSDWPDYPDKTRLKRFLLGYDSVNVISKAELQVVPLLMCEAMVAEAVLPIAATGSFGRMQGFPFLQMIRRKVKWVLDHLDEIRAVLKD